MHCKLLVVLFFGAFMGVKGTIDIDSIFNVGDFNFTLGGEPAPDIPHTRNKRNVKNYLPAALSCALKSDVGCLIENAENYLEEKRVSVIAEADAAAVQMRGRSDGESPSELASMIGNVISEMTSIFKDSFAGFFRDSKEADEEDEEEEDYDENGLDQTAIEENKKERQNVEEDRGKKKKQKLKAIIKLLILGVVLYAKAILLLKFLAWKVQVKFLLIALGNLLINGLKIWWEFKAKSSHNPQKVIYYEHAQHQHHYDGGGEDWESSGPPSGGGGGYWGRSYDDKEMLAAQEMAYNRQRPKPADYLANAKKTGSWFSK